MTERPTVEDYAASDGYDDFEGLECCPRCRVLFSGNCHLGPVRETDGTRHDTIYESDPNFGPFFCEDCWTILDRNRRIAENHALTEFATPGGVE